MKRNNETNVVHYILARFDKSALNTIQDNICFVLHYFPKISQNAILTGHVVCGAPTELTYIARFVAAKTVDARKVWFFELGVKSGVDVPIPVIVGFQNRIITNDNTRENSVFYGPYVLTSHGIIRTVTFLEMGIKTY